MRKLLVVFLLIHFFGPKANAQEEIGFGKVWTSVYLTKKISPHWYFDNYLMMGLKQTGQVAFVQNDMSFRYRFTKSWSMSATYKHAQYAAFPGYDKVYSQPITVFGSIIFHGAALELQYDKDLGKSFRISQSLTAQAYFPKFEKYQFRYISTTKLAYDNKKAFLRITPYVKFMLYYYQNGKSFNYFDDNGQMEAYQAPNGFHRYRAIFGFSFKPIKKVKQLGFNFYYAINREFNFSNSKSKLNTSTPTASANAQLARVPFNNYNVFGVQVNVILGMNKR